MAIGGVKNEVCKFNAINIAKKYGLTPKNSTNGKNIGTNIIKISVHSRGQPNKKIIIFLLGWPLEWTEILIIFVPIFLPLLEIFGVDPYFFAMLIALNLQTSFLTPPMAMSAYYLKGVQSKNVELMEIFRGIMPFLGIVILAMVLMYIFPGIALWLPDVLFAN